MKHLTIALLVSLLTSLLSCSSELATVPIKETVICKPTEDIVFVIDVSSSMLAQDFSPNRLEVVKVMLERMIHSKEEQQRLSLVIFAGEALVLCPLTNNTTTLLQLLKTIEAGSITDGTAIGVGLLFGLFELSKGTSTIKKIVLLTDGVNNTGQYSPTLATQLAQNQKVSIHSFGIGCQGLAQSPIAKRPNGTYIFGDVPVEIDEKLLKKIGTQTEGDYTRVTCKADVQPLQSLNSLFHTTPPIHLPETLPAIDTLTINSIWQAIESKNNTLLKQYLQQEKQLSSSVEQH